MTRRTRQACVFCLNPVTIKCAAANGRKNGVKKERDKPSGVVGVNDGFQTCKLLENEMTVVFVVRKLLSIPLNECKQLLENFGSPSSWVEICEDCTKVVNEAREVYRKICALEKELEGCKVKVKEKIVLSTVLNSNLGSERRSKRRKLNSKEEMSEAATQIRTLLLKDDASVTASNLLDSGNILVKEELQEFEIEEDSNDFDYFQEENSAEALGSVTMEENVEIKDDETDERILQKTKNCKENDASDEEVSYMDGDVYKCSYCSASFKAEITLAVHLRKIHWVYRKRFVSLGLKYPTRWKCRYCDERLQTFNAFKKHCIDKHNMFACDKCPRLLTTWKSLCRHNKTLHDNILRKKKTKRTTVTKKTDDESIIPLPPVKTFTIGDLEVYQCMHCNYCNKQKPKVRKHIYEMHWAFCHQLRSADSPVSLKCDKCVPSEENDSENNFTTVDELNNHKVSAHGMLKCSNCDCVFLSIGYLENHQLTYHSAENADPSCWYRDDNVSTQSSKITKRPHCKFCQETFDTPKQLTQHNLNEHTSEMFRCDKCSELFDRVSRLYSHKTKVHKESNNPYKCSQCDYTHRLYRQVHLHYMNIHEKRHRMVCELCSATFASERYLEYHKAQKHGQGDSRGVRSHCTQCNKTFSTPAYLAVHITTVHLGQWRYKCSYCGIGFVGQKQVDHHVNIVHKKVFPYECTVEGCDKKFAATWQIKQHLRIKHGPRTFKCAYCDFAAGVRSRVRQHEKRHTDVGPHTCDHCGKSYGQYKCLQQHLRLTHKIRCQIGRKAELTPFVLSITGEKNNERDNQISPDTVGNGIIEND